MISISPLIGHLCAVLVFMDVGIEPLWLGLLGSERPTMTMILAAVYQMRDEEPYNAGHIPHAFPGM